MTHSIGRAEAVARDAVFAGGGEMGALMRSMDWSETLLGRVEAWPQSLRTSVSIALNSRFPLLIWWGAELSMLYNDAYRPILGTKHPAAMGAPGREVWPEIWDVIGPMHEAVLFRGEATWSRDQLLVLGRYGYAEECYFSFSFSPIRDETGGVGGVFTVTTETTERVVGERRLRTLRELGARTSAGRTAEAACELAAEVLEGNPADIPFALLYLLEESGRAARLVGTAGLEPGTPASPAVVPLTDSADDGGAWPLARVARSGQGDVVEELEARFGSLPGGPWPDSPGAALVLPVMRPGQEQPYGLLIVAVSPRRPLDDDYRGFFDLVAGQVATAVGSARAHEEDRARAEELAELDRAKTTFFSNVSHEFRTPLTLMLGPVENTLAHDDSAPLSEVREELEVAYRNSLRLLKLVNTLLDFSRIEAGRVEASYEPTDLARFTAELASMFRSAVEKAGLRLVVDTPPLPEPAYVDRDMWEKIVLNLLSNAFKFTFEGEILVSLEWLGDHIDLEVRDTGVGIPANEIPHLFERFHRVEGVRARTQEGSGIGLSLVRELVKLHGGKVAVRSEVGVGSAFTVSIPTGKAHLPAERIGARRTLASTAMGASPYVEEALRWIPEAPGEAAPAGAPPAAPADHRRGPAPVHGAPPAAPAPGTAGARILLADDNADMREYVRRLLGKVWNVEAVPDGAAALTAARERTPDLVLADVMMPRLDGFELLRELRADAKTREIPVILLSARAGEEARVEGLKAGADDYLTKPFAARELVATVNAHLELARSRQETVRAREEVLAVVSHDLKNPIHTISMAASLLLEPALPEEKKRTHAETIRRVAARMDRLVRDLLDISRIEAGRLRIERRREDTALLMTEVCRMHAPLAEEKALRLDCEFPDDLPAVFIDRDRMLQVFGNLVGNAIKFTPEGGRVTLRGEPSEGMIHFSVSDTGPGIAAEELTHLFDPFWQAEQHAGKGVGLGLTIAKGIIEAHGGEIWVESTPEKGTTFHFTVPAAASGE